MAKTDNVLIRFKATGFTEMNAQIKTTIKLLKQLRVEQKKAKIKIKVK